MRILMQRLPGTVPDKTGGLRDTMASHRVKLLLALAVVVGALFGVLLAARADADILMKLDFLFNSNYTQRSSMPSATIFIASSASTFLFLLVCFLFGLAVWGIALAPFLPFIRGIGLGMTSGYLYVTEGGWGALFYLIVLLPGAFVSCIAILLGAESAMDFSKSLRKSGFAECAEDPPSTSRYIQRLGAALLLGFFGAVLDTLLAAAFARCFPF